jgi:hypothetical protein
MHPAAHKWVERFGSFDAVTVLDIGGRNINGTIRDCFPCAARYVAVDLYPGVGVDVVGDVCEWETDETFDVVVCCEVLEHAPNWKEIVGTAYDRCKDGGKFVMTCAGPGRAVHSGVDGQWRLHEGEHYGNVSPEELSDALASMPWASFAVDQTGQDVRCVAVK